MIRFMTYIALVTTLIPFVFGGNPSSYTDSARGTINLSSLSAEGDKPKYADVVPYETANWKYSFNPCKPFSEGEDRQEVAVCQVSADGQLQFVLGKQDSAEWNSRSGSNPTLRYTYFSPAGPKNVDIELICDKNVEGNLVALGEFTVGLYKFQLTSKCACWNGCKDE